VGAATFVPRALPDQICRGKLRLQAGCYTDGLVLIHSFSQNYSVSEPVHENTHIFLLNGQWKYSTGFTFSYYICTSRPIIVTNSSKSTERTRKGSRAHMSMQKTELAPVKLHARG
jgi:hypothetical protein